MTNLRSYKDISNHIGSSVWLRVWNKGAADEDEMLYLGGQTEGKSTGFYHTGAKFYFLACMYNGTEVLFLSEDSGGKYAISYDIELSQQGEKAIACIGRGDTVERKDTFRMVFAGDTMARPLGTDQNRHYKAVSQAVINAAEAAAQNGSPSEWGVGLSSELPRDGYTAAYFELNAETRDLLKYFSFYFPTKNPHVVGGGTKVSKIADLRWAPERKKDPADYSIYVLDPMTDDTQFSVYSVAGDIENGVMYLIYTRDGRHGDDGVSSAVGEYVVQTGDSRILNSDRELSDYKEFTKLMSDAWASCTDVALLSKFLKAAGDSANIESEFGELRAHRDPEALRTAFGLAFPNGFIKTYNYRASSDAKCLGGEEVELGWSLQSALKSAGVTTAEEFAGYTTDGLMTRPVTTGDLAVISVAVHKISKFGLAAKKVTYNVIFNRSNNITGQADPVNRTISLWHELLLPGQHSELVKTLVHEHRHILFGGDGHGLDFVEHADTQLTNIVLGK